MESPLDAGVSIQKMEEEFLDLQKWKETLNANSISAHKNKTKHIHSHQVFYGAWCSHETFQSGAVSVK